MSESTVIIDKKIKDLEGELARWKAIRDRHLPEPVVPTNKTQDRRLVPLRKTCMDAMEYYYSPEYHEDGIKDHEGCVYEEAMMWCYGPDIFERLNKEVFI